MYKIIYINSSIYYGIYIHITIFPLPPVPLRIAHILDAVAIQENAQLTHSSQV